jgi:hypothetical protein
MVDALSAHLTQPDVILARAIRETPAGMAHWAGSGPDGRTCRECAAFDHQKSYYAKKGLGGGLLKPAKCRKFATMTGQSGGRIPFETRACKYFDLAEAVPPVVAK